MSTVLGPGPDRLIVDGRDVSAVIVARTHREKGRGLLGFDALEGALWLDGTSSVHMMGMRFGIDVAVLDKQGRVLHTGTLRPWTGATRPRFRGRAVIEAPEGAMLRWGVRIGSVCSVSQGAESTGSESSEA